MEVSTAELYETDAFVIGGTDAIECGITGDAYFMQVLSSTLYKNPERAMVREVLCNAWDAHLDAGVTEPVEVTLTPTELVIKDFGAGISHDQIGPIYGVYGASTKRQNSLATGGFGLGCKSPWSYTDSFTVISCHKGFKSIYQMLRASEETDGKPCIKPIVVGIPTDETGLTVKIPIKDTKNNRIDNIIEDLVTKFSFFGRMATKFNGEILTPFDRNLVSNNWILCNHNDLYDVDGDSNVTIIYGDVAYDFDMDALPDMDSYLDSALETYNSWLQKRSGAKLILFAEPNTITPAPSRDVLSNSSLTIATVTKLLNAFFDDCNKNFKKEALKAYYAKMYTLPKQDFIYRPPYPAAKYDPMDSVIGKFTDLKNRVTKLDLFNRFRTYEFLGLSEKTYLKKMTDICVRTGALPHGWMRIGDHERNGSILFRIFERAGIPFRYSNISLINDDTHYSGKNVFYPKCHYPRFITIVVLYTNGTITERKNLVGTHKSPAFCIRTTNKDNELQRLKLTIESMGLTVLVHDVPKKTTNTKSATVLKNMSVRQSFKGVPAIGTSFVFCDRITNRVKYRYPEVESLTLLGLDHEDLVKLVDLFGDLGECVYTLQHIRSREKRGKPTMLGWLIKHFNNVILKDPIFLKYVGVYTIKENLSTLEFRQAASIGALIQDPKIGNIYGFDCIDMEEVGSGTDAFIYKIWSILNQRQQCNNIVLDPKVQAIKDFIKRFENEHVSYNDTDLYGVMHQHLRKKTNTPNWFKLTELYKQAILLTYLK